MGAPEPSVSRRGTWALLGVPLLATIGSATVATLLWVSFLREADSQVRTHLEETAASIAQHIDDGLALREHSLRRLARRYERETGSGSGAWIADADDYLATFPELTVIGALDDTGSVSWSRPPGSVLGAKRAGAPSTIVGEFTVTPLSTSTFEDPVVVWDQAKPDRQGRRLFVVCRLHRFFERILTLEIRDATLQYELTHGTSVLYRGGATSDLIPERRVLTKLHSLPEAYTVVATPSSATLDKMRSRLPDLAFVVGLVASLLLGFALLVSRRLRSIANTQTETAEALRLTNEREAKARALFEILFDASPDSVLLVDAAGRIHLANPQAERAFGWERGELVGVSVESLMPERHRVNHVPLREAYAFSGEARRMSNGLVTNGLRRDGVEFPTSISLAPVRIDGAMMVLTVIRDVSDQVRAHAALRASEERYREFFSGTPTASAVSLMDGTILSCNPAFAELFGFASPEAASGTRSAALYPEPARRAEVLADLVRDGAVRARALTLTRCDGTPVHVLLNIVAQRDAAGNVTEMMSHIVDLSALRVMEERLREAAKLDALGRLAGGVAHDFNNLLTAITGYGSMLLAATPPTHPHHPWCMGIVAAAECAAGLTGQLLSFSRRQVLSPKPLDLGHVVASMTTMLGRIIGEHITLGFERAATIHLVLADRSQLEQVVLNLVVNARDAMPRGGRIRLETRNAAPPETPPGRWVRLSVADEGTGMTPEVRARVFEPFFTSKEHGTGLGMATVHGAVQQSGGRIEIDTQVGAGTTVRVYFPGLEDAPSIVAPLAPGVHPDDARPPPARTTTRILVVEDSPLIRDLICGALGARGYEVAPTGSAETALALIRSGPPPDLVLTDVVLPGKSGRELADEIQGALPKARILFVSGYAPDDAIQARVGAGLGTFLAKPFTATQLVVAVEHALARERPA